MPRLTIFLFAFTFLAQVVVVPQRVDGKPPETLVVDMHHLRSGDDREWDEFPETVNDMALIRRFAADVNESSRTIRLRQQDVKLNWQVAINDEVIGRLPTDENDMVVYFDVEPGLLRKENTITVQPSGNHKSTDDIRVGQIVLLGMTRDQALSQARMTIRIVEDGQPVPGRITILDADGAMASVGTGSSKHLAVRPGTVYTATGIAEIELPTGVYRLIASRGFEYSIAHTLVDLSEGDDRKIVLPIRRQVDTAGWIACDTHVHSRTHSGHGDSTVEERMVTLAGEGIELPIATDHNVQINHEPFAVDAGVRQFFTPIIGNEVTTKTGHFNVFPVQDSVPPPPHQQDDWKATLDGIYATPGVRVAILNHARDVHSGTTPFGPRHFNEAAGEMLDDWHVGFNAMEILNSGATQTDVLQLTRDWMTLLNRGRRITPVGSSDSHDVSRYIVGQGRTYIRCDDSEPGKIDIETATEAFISGRVSVSYGLMTELLVNGSGKSGDLVTATGDGLKATVVVRGPEWVIADKLQLFANGSVIEEVIIDSSRRSEFPEGVIYQGTIKLASVRHDTHIVAVATGPGIDSLHWPAAKPYQPDSTAWTARTFSCSGAVFVDVDGNEKFQSAHALAASVVKNAKHQLPRLIVALKDYDEAVATQAALLMHRSGVSPLDLLDRELLADSTALTRRGFMAYVNAWRTTEQARIE